MFKKIISFLKSKKTGVICIGGNVKDSFIVNQITPKQEITINGKKYKGTTIEVNSLGIFVDGVKQKP